MSEISDILENLERLFGKIKSDLELENLPPECQPTLKGIRTDFNRLKKNILAHERKDRLIDDLYFSVGSRLNTTFDVCELLGVILDSLGKLISFNAAGIFLVNHRSAQIEAEVVCGYYNNSLKQVHQKVGEGILGWVIAQRKPQIINDVTKDPRYINARPQTRSEMAVPLISGDEVIGCINLESDRLNSFKKEDLALLETFATQASLAVERARLQNQILEKKVLEEELAWARKIQLSLLPLDPPHLPGYDLAGLNIPTSAVGGDYYDFIPLPEGGLGLAIADVSGKGMAAALIMSGFRAALRAEIRHKFPPPDLMHKVNHFVKESIHSGGFVTAFFGALKNDTLRYINAGHNPPILLRKNGEYELLESGGTVLGLTEEQYFEEGTVNLLPADTLLFYTDGVTEAMNSEQVEFGIERLVRILKETGGLPMQERIKAIHHRVIDFSASTLQADDFTLMGLTHL